MSLQVCHCGWSKVTSYHGLRTHQGKMGCTPRGVKVEESEQQYLWGAQAFSKEFSLDGYISVKTDYSETSLQVCHCGWSKVTTYHGLRTHQGMMGCQLKGIKILKQEQYDRKSQWEEVDQRKLQPVKRTTVKKENAPSALSTNVRTSFVERTATIKEEYKSPQRDPRWSSHRARNSTSTQLNVSVRENPTPTYLEDWTLQTLPKIADSRRIAENSSMDRPVNFATTAATVKEEPKSPLAIQRWSSQRITNSKSGRQAQDLSVGVQVTRSVRECPNIPPPAPVVQPMEKDMRAQTLSHSLVREWPTTTYPATVVRPKERHQKNQTSQNVPVSPSIHSGLAIQRRSSQSNANSKSGRQAHDLSTGVQVNRASRECPTTPTTVVQPKENDTKDPTLSQARQETVKSELQQKIKLQEEKMSEIREWTERACESVQDIVRTNTPINSTAAETTTKEDPKSSYETAPPVFSTGMKVKSFVRECPTTTYPATVDQPKGKHSEDQTLSQVNRSVRERPKIAPRVSLVQPKEKDMNDQTLSQGMSSVMEHPMTTHPATVVQPKERHQKNQTLSQDMTVQPKEKDREVQNISQNVPDSTSATTQFNPASAEATTEEDPKLSCETAQPPDFSTGLKVKELAQMFSTQETAVQPKRKHGEEQKLSQAKVIAKKLSATIAQQKEKDKENQNISQNVLDSTSGTTQMNPATAQATTVQDPTSSCETAQLPDFSTGLKVKDLAQMFSSTTTQETDVQPKRKHRAERRPSQVKLIARKLSAATAQDTAVHPKQRDKWM
ncbi:triadin isoform X16 [Dicentrarchus labrax]|uniref:triadin isoform X16 n=1 Tax=Dicentrarchus labrax TaxID=13489 RepID=UPI0021F580B7|nr:triadin isoform X16 [Dicentrarchus labrax]